MNLFKGAERLMGMDDATWARHANPWSGITRMAALPLLALAVWSRVWLGWFALIPVALAIFWVWWNPRAFAVPARFDHWMSRGVLGEKVYLDKFETVAAHHKRAARWLTLASVPGMLLLIWGLIALWWEGVVFGILLTVLPKMWFVDRMAWVFEDWRRQGGHLPGLIRGVADV